MLDVLVVDDDDIVRESIAAALVDAGHHVAQATDGAHALAMLATRAFELVVCDVQMPKLDGLALFRRLRRDAPGTAVVMMTSYAKIPDAVGSLRDGAVDYVTKPFDPEEFAAKIVAPIAERRALKRRFDEVRAEFVVRAAGASIVGVSLAMRQLIDRLGVVAKCDTNVLISGGRGTGKKLVARTIHAQSPRRDGPFLVVPCASLPELMAASDSCELSEARPRSYRDEWFRAAEGGTLVLDGVDRLPAAAQALLVRVLDEPATAARRSREWLPVGVRVIGLTRDDPSIARASGALGDPLYRRLSAAVLSLPALPEREGDLYLLTCHFLREFTPPGRSAPSLSPEAWGALTAYSFPGNVRELAWALEHAVVASEGGEIALEHLPEEISQHRTASTAGVVAAERVG